MPPKLKKMLCSSSEREKTKKQKNSRYINEHNHGSAPRTVSSKYNGGVVEEDGEVELVEAAWRTHKNLLDSIF